MRIAWRPGELPGEVPLTPERCHDVGRIIEESFTNVLKHARASVVLLSTGVELEGGRRFVVLCIADDGEGETAAGPAAPGYGIRNMRARAEAMGGRLDVEHRPGGTEVRLWLPFDEVG